MSLRDVSRGGRPIPGALNGHRRIPIIGGRRHPLQAPHFLEVAIMRVDPPQAATETSAGHGYRVMLAGARTDRKNAGFGFDVPANATPMETLQIVAKALNYLTSFRNCTCPEGTVCDLHRPKAPSDPQPVEPPTGIVLTDK